MDPHRKFLNWGIVLKLPEDEQLNVVREWVACHTPADRGYQGANSWLYRRQRLIEKAERLRPQVEKRFAQFQASRSRPVEPDDGPDVWEWLRTHGNRTGNP